MNEIGFIAWRYENCSKGYRGIHFQFSNRSSRVSACERIGNLKEDGDAFILSTSNGSAFSPIVTKPWNREIFEACRFEFTMEEEPRAEFTNRSNLLILIDHDMKQDILSILGKMAPHSEGGLEIRINKKKSQLTFWWDRD